MHQLRCMHPTGTNLQVYGFTCGLADVLLVDSANHKRDELLRGADVRALDAAATLVGLPSPLALLKEGRTPVGGAGGLGGLGGAMAQGWGAGRGCRKRAQQRACTFL